MNLATSTQLILEYAERSWNYELPDHLEQALENDYVKNSHLYSDKTFKCIQMTVVLIPEINSEKLLRLVKSWAECDDDYQWHNQCRHGEGFLIAAAPSFQSRACCRR